MLTNLLAVANEPAFLGLVSIDSNLILQVINTIVLVVVLKKLLFKPVKDIIDQRQELITDQLDDAKNKNEEAETLIADYNERIASIEEEGRVMIHEASVKADKRANEIVKAAEAEAELIKIRAEKEIEREKLKAVNELKEEIVSLSLLAASKVLERDIDESKHKSLISQFLEEVGDTTWQN
jgi:F-type H+-transporting ATPase subunit b